MERYENTQLWQGTLGSQGDANIERLRVVYQSLRNRMMGLLDEVRQDFPNLTVHSIEHTDDLWNKASLITGEGYPMNPLEGFVLGCSFLVHDSVLSYKAFGGKDALRDTTLWRDYYQDIVGTEDDTEEEKHKIDFKVIRHLHADSCGDILSKPFKGVDGNETYLMEDEDMRTHYGELIGEIASSHHWEIENLRNLPAQVNALADFPSEWTIHPQKLACILRCADAAAIDSGRAPNYLFRLLRLNDFSKEHWLAQNRLAIGLNKDNTTMVITSTQDFKEQDFLAWNVAYDAVKVIESELEKCCALLPESEKFKVRSVAGAKSRKALSEFIRTKGWTPYDVNVHISDVAKLVKTLGGKELYGKEDHQLIVLRELIQNARDAVKARRLQEGEDNFKGKIQIKVSHTDRGTELEVTDDGVGMSLETISHSLLNFGHSFWHEDDVTMEFPGLKAKGYQSIGQYGIGFFSAFMISKAVEVCTRKYTDGLENSHLVKFPNGLTLAPIFAKHTSSTMAESTRVTLVLDDAHHVWPTEYEVERNEVNSVNFKVPMAAMLRTLVIGLDVDVYYQEFEKSRELIHERIDSPNLDKKTWLRTLSLADYQNDRSLDEYIDSNCERLQFIYDEKERVVGLAAIGTRFLLGQDFLGGSTVGGLLTAMHSRKGEYWIGVLEKYPGGANRNGGEFKASESVIRDWTNGQVKMLGKEALIDMRKRFCMQLAMQFFKTDPMEIAVAFCLSGSGKPQKFALNELVREMSQGKKLLFLDSDFMSKKENEGHGESYTDISRVASYLKPDEWLYCPIINSDFLTYKIVDEIPVRNLGFIDCLYRKAEDMGYQLLFSYRKDFAMNYFGEKDRALVMEVKKRN